ncbi:NADP-dependent oxidoreductase [Mucilaginibacter sp.]|uniref:NADP-dependent oxidoreductase n=1 Tax=Mucilaginibacter sp. TaxID=1882438 RepID=UPI002607DB14|nr:NADP-dependent oxidoreductase [Mucilaginibacter sp.]MDB5127302.1 NADP-dependent oxidoreductase [Mucilaginibacter sp.]
MKAYELKEAGSVDQLQMVEIDKPVASANEVVIKSKAISINPVDIKTRIGKSLYNEFKENYSPIIIGWDVSGVVESVGESVSQFKPGDEIFGMINFPGHGKAYAEYVSAPVSQIAKKPANISHEEAAAATLAALTAYQILRNYVKAGDRILIQAGAGGVGHFAVQMAKIIGAHVTATTSAKNIDFVKALGADNVIDYTKQPFENAISNLDFVLDALGGDTLRRSIQTVKAGGKIVSLPSGALLDEIKAQANDRQVEAIFQMVVSSGEDMKQIAGWMETGKLKAEVSQIFTFDQLKEAHTAVETGRTRGKIVIKF